MSRDDDSHDDDDDDDDDNDAIDDDDDDNNNDADDDNNNMFDNSFDEDYDDIIQLAYYSMLYQISKHFHTVNIDKQRRLFTVDRNMFPCEDL